MKPRICIIGDSHVAALKLALSEPHWDAQRDQVTIFGARGDGLTSTEIKNGKLVSSEPAVRRQFQMTAGVKRIELDQYDAFCVVGCRLNFHQAKDVIASYTTYALGMPERRLVSEDLFEYMMSAMLMRSISARVVDMLRTVSAKPIYVMPDPLWSPRVLEFEKGKVVKEMIALGVTAGYRARLRSATRAAFKGRATLVTQPDDSIVDGCLTDMKYTIGSISLSVHGSAHGDHDFAHMSAAYGDKMLKVLFAAIAN